MDSRANFIGFLSIKVPLNFLGKCQIGPDFDWWMACKMPFEIPRGIWVPEKISLAFCSPKSHGKMTQKSHFSRGFLACYRQLARIWIKPILVLLLLWFKNFLEVTGSSSSGTTLFGLLRIFSPQCGQLKSMQFRSSSKYRHKSFNSWLSLTSSCCLPSNWCNFCW